MKKTIRRTMKRIIAVTLITTLTVGTCAAAYADDSTTYIPRQEQEKAGVEYVIQCGKFDKQCGSSTIDGKVIETEEIATLHDGIMSMLDDSTVVNDVNYLGNSVIANDVNTYATNMYNVNAGSVNLSDVIVAENNISFGASTVNSDSAILYSKNGDISFYCGDVTFTGVIYAPNGTVRFEGSNININGVIIAKDVIVRAGTFNVNYNSSVAESVDNLDYIEVNELFDLSIYNNEEEQTKSLQWETSSSIETIDIYARYGSDDFKKISTTKDEMYAIDNEAIVDVADYYVVANTKFGEEILSNIVTLVKGEEGIYEDSIDSDKDGIPDGYEYLIGTDALNPDTDGDGFSDGYEVNVLCTDPLTYDEDKDFDNDGFTNLQEMELGTNPYLKDSDFDGIIDSIDETPMKANVNTGIEVDYNIPINIGIFDLVSKYLDEDGNRCQIVYNYVNGQTKYMSDSKNRSYNLYNNKNQVVAAIEYVDDRIIANIYSYNGDKIETITHNGFQYEFSYDEAGNMTNAMIGSRTLISNKYSEGNLVLEKYGNNNLNQYVYDENGNVITQEINGNIAYKWTYDDKGNITSYSDLYSDEIYTYTYDEAGNVKAIDSNKGFKITYYEDDNTYSVTYEDENTSKTQEVTISEKENEAGDINEVTTTNLISNGKLVSVVTGDTTSERTIYEDNRIIIHNKYTSSEDGVTKIEYQDGKILEYEYDKCGNIVSVNECGERKISYEYDDLGQLIRENNLYANKTIVYVYDNAGNILESKEYLYSTDILGECISEKKYKYQDNEWKDLLTNYNGENITYDQIGNPLSYRDGMEFTWVGRQLATIQTEQDVISYKYNSNGIRTSKTVNDIETTYQLDGTKIISETTNGNIIWYIYDENNYIIGFEYVGKTYYFEKNAQGDVTRIFDAERNFISEYFYDAWGNVISVVGNEEIAKINPFRYRGYYCDNETNFYYLQSRYYDSCTSRFINADDVRYICDNGVNIGYNLYIYGRNNPVLYVDYTGHVVTPANVIGAIVGGIIGAVGGYFLSRWLADKIGLSGWKRKVFIVGLTAIATATAAVIGYFIGPYIANKWSSIRQSIFKHCFEGGTLINTSIGMIPIEEIKEGMLVYSQNVVNGEKDYKTVISTTSHLVYEVVQIKTELEVLVTTESHPFWVGSQGWKNAGDIVKGDELKLEDGNSASVIDIEVIKLEKPIRVYNFEVAGWHTYFVGGSSILVHNGACGISLNKLSDSYIKRLGLNAHSIKYEYLGRGAKISLYDLAVDKKTGIIYIINKAGAIITETIYKTK